MFVFMAKEVRLLRDLFQVLFRDIPRDFWRMLFEWPVGTFVALFMAACVLFVIGAVIMMLRMRGGSGSGSGSVLTDLTNPANPLGVTNPMSPLHHLVHPTSPSQHGSHTYVPPYDPSQPYM